MKNVKYLLGFVFALWASALSAQTHWSVTPTDYMNHMTVWFVLQDENNAPVDFSNYELAAFVGNDCRGVGTVVTQDDKTAYQLMIYSNQASGENITFKCYNKTTEEERYASGSPAITFTSDGSVGLPSSPYAIVIAQPYIPGDADGDGVVDLTDAVAIFTYYMYGEYPNFNEAAADFDGDGVVDLTDAVLVFNYYMNQ